MSLGLTEQLASSTSFRLAAMFAILLASSFLLAGVGVVVATRSAALNESDRRLRIEIDAIGEATRTGGFATAAATLAQRSAYHPALIYSLRSRGAVAGDPSLPTDRIGRRIIDLPDAPDGAWRGDHLVVTSALPGDVTLSVADDLERAEDVRNALLSTLLWIGAATLLAGIAVARWLTRRTLSRMDALSDTVQAVAGGNLAVRMPLRNATTPDDLDRLGASFNDMLDQIDRLVASVRRVSTNVAHDLRTPLTHAGQQLETALAATTNEERERALLTIQASIAELLRTFDALLSLSEIEAGTTQRFATVDLSAVVERVTDAYRPDIEASGRTLAVQTPGPILIQGETHLLTRALANLVENAIRHTPLGAHILVEGAEGDCATLSVSDNGAGVPAVHRDRVIEPFERLDESRQSPGSGIGLSIVAAVARLHGATLSLDDAHPGLRATLRFSPRRI